MRDTHRPGRRVRHAITGEIGTVLAVVDPKQRTVRFPKEHPLGWVDRTVQVELLEHFEPVPVPA